MDHAPGCLCTVPPSNRVALRYVGGERGGGRLPCVIMVVSYPPFTQALHCDTFVWAQKGVGGQYGVWGTIGVGRQYGVRGTIRG